MLSDDRRWLEWPTTCSFFRLCFSHCAQHHHTLRSIIWPLLQEYWHHLPHPASSDQPPSPWSRCAVSPWRHLHCLLCALIGRVAGSQWLDCQMTSRKGFKLVETAGHPAHPLLTHLISWIKPDIAETCSSFPFLFASKLSFPRKMMIIISSAPIPHFWQDLARTTIHSLSSNQFETILQQHLKYLQKSHKVV